MSYRCVEVTQHQQKDKVQAKKNFNHSSNNTYIYYTSWTKKKQYTAKLKLNDTK